MKLSNLQDIKYNTSINTTTNTLFTQYAITSTNLYFLLNRLTKSVDSEAKEKRITNILHCSQGGKFYRLYLDSKFNEWELVRVEQGCNSRVCPTCMEKYKSKIRRTMRLNLDSFDSVRFLTPSFQSTTQLTKNYIKQCSSDFSRLREYLARTNTVGKYRKVLHKLFKLGRISEVRYNNVLNHYTTYPSSTKLNLIKRYIIVLEIKYNKEGTLILNEYGKEIGKHKGNNWNLHYHMIYDGEYIPRELLSYNLERVTRGESFFIGIKYISPYSVRSKEKALNYITKYLSKISFKSDDYEVMLEYYSAIEKIRFYKTLGVKMTRLPYFYIPFREWLLNMYTDTDIINEKVISFHLEMEKFKLSRINLELSIEENVMRYSENEVILSCLYVGKRIY